MKICGLTRVEDVLLARDLGVWALGFVFAPSPRRLTPAAARGLLEQVAAAAGPPDLATAPLAVGVFGDAPVREIARVVTEVGLDAVQLHGESGPGAARVREALAASALPVLVIQAVPVAPDAPDSRALGRAIAKARAEADLILLDTRTGRRFGGTGAPFPWSVARQAAEGAPFLVAGGIGPDNVLAALEESGAWGVDVSTGVESSPGIKDGPLVRQLLARVDAARGSAGRGSAARGSDAQCGDSPCRAGAMSTVAGWSAGTGTDQRQKGSGT